MSDEKPAPATARQKERIKQIALVVIGAALGALGVELGVIDDPVPDCAPCPVVEVECEHPAVKSPEP